MATADHSNDLPPITTGVKSAADIRAEAAERARAGGGGTTPRRQSRAGTPPSPAAPPVEDDPRKLTPKFKVLREGVLEIYTAAEMATYLFDAETAMLISAQKEKCADAWIELARKDTKVASLLTKLTTGSAWGGVIMAHMSIFLPVLARKGVIPGGALFGATLMNAMDSQPAAPLDPDEDIFTGFVTAQ